LSEYAKEKTLIVNGMSKSYSMTGWRIGYTCGDAEIISAMTKLQSQSTSNPTSISQMAAVEALNGPQDSVAMMREKFEERRDYIVKALNEMDKISCVKPKGAFYVFPNVSKYYGTEYNGRKINNSMDFSMVLLEEANVAVVPGIAFGDDSFVRISYATDMETIKRGMQALKEFLSALK